jgi:hypothetical protein
VERFDAAAAVSRMAAERGWPLFELRHEVPTLESVFLEQTAGPRAQREGESAS